MNSGIIDYNSFIMIIKKIELYKDNEEKLINNINKSLGLLSSYYSGNNSKNIKNKIIKDSFDGYKNFRLVLLKLEYCLL